MDAGNGGQAPTSVLLSAVQPLQRICSRRLKGGPLVSNAEVEASNATLQIRSSGKDLRIHTALGNRWLGFDLVYLHRGDSSML